MRHIRRPTLQKKFALAFIIVAATTILLLGNLALYLVSYSHQLDIRNLQNQLVGQVEQEIGKYFGDTLGILDLTISSEDVRYIDIPQQLFFAQGFLNDQPMFDEVSFVSVTDEHLPRRLDRSYGTETLRLNRDGKEVTRDVSQLEYFIAAAQGKKYIGNVEYTPSGPYVRIAAPVRDRNGAIIDVITARINLASLISSIESKRLGQSGFVFILDKEGRVLAGNAMKKGESLSRFSRVRNVLAGTIQNGLGKDDYYVGYGTKVASVGSGKLLPSIRWAVFTEWPLADANSIIDQIRQTIFTVVFGCAIAALLLAYLVARRMTEPIRLLESGASDIAKGKLDTRISIETDDELSDLGSSFNTMAEGLKELDTLRTEYTHVMTHELRAPVTAIRGYVSLLTEQYASVLTEEGNKFLRIVQESADNLSALINDLLEVAKIESGKISIDLADVDVSSVVADAITELSIVAKEGGISLQYEAAQQPVMMKMDAMRLKQIIINLLSNSIKYNKQGGWIKISCVVGLHFVSITVEDGGVGMTEEQLSHLFEKFYRVAGQEHIIGTGLGLYLSKILTEAMGGKISVESTYGTGTKFTVTFPTTT